MGKIIFSKASVILSTGGLHSHNAMGRQPPQTADPTHLLRPLRRQTPLQKADPQDLDTATDMVNKRAVRILLESLFRIIFDISVVSKIKLRSNITCLSTKFFNLLRHCDLFPIHCHDDQFLIILSLS